MPKLKGQYNRSMVKRQSRIQGPNGPRKKKENTSKQRKIEEAKDKVEVDGFLISKKLLSRDSERICPVCETYSFDKKDDLYMNKYDCCFKCYVEWVESREERWESGWRPEKIETSKRNW